MWVFLLLLVWNHVSHIGFSGRKCTINASNYLKCRKKKNFIVVISVCRDLWLIQYKTRSSIVYTHVQICIPSSYGSSAKMLKNLTKENILEKKLINWKVEKKSDWISLSTKYEINRGEIKGKLLPPL